MSIPNITAPMLISPEAYLNGVLVGYGELEQIPQFAEMSNWHSGFIDYVVVGHRHEGWLNLIPDQVGFVLDIADNYRDASFQGHSLGCLVVISAVSFDQPLTTRVLLKEVRRRSPYSQSLCNLCSYFMKGNPSVCNAFHSVDNVTECQDFRTD